MVTKEIVILMRQESIRLPLWGRCRYARIIEGLDGRHPGGQVFDGLPGSANELLIPFGMNLLRHPTGVGAPLGTEERTRWHIDLLGAAP